MTSIAKQSAQRSRSRKRKGITVADLMSATQSGKGVSFFEQLLLEHPEFSFLKKWGLRKYYDDPEASAVIARMYKFWPRLTAEERYLYLRAAESIAEAEKAKNSWNPKGNRHRYIRLAKNAVAAAKLVSELNTLFQSLDENSAIGDLVERLASFVGGVVAAAAPMDRNVSVISANRLLRIVNQRRAKKARATNWELVRDLAWLASGKKLLPSERTVRRYLDEVRIMYGPAKKLIERNWELIRTASRFASRDISKVVENHAQVYLQDI